MTNEEEASQEQILRTAVEEFIEKGIEGARMQAIADRAGFNKAMIHYYFRNKDNLYRSALRFIMTDFEQALSSTIHGPTDLSSFIDRLTETFFKYHKENPGFIRLMMREISGGMVSLKTVMTDHGLIQNHMKQMVEKIAGMQSEKIIRSDIPPFHVLLTMMGMMGSSMLQTHTITMMTGTNFDEFLEARQSAIRKILNTSLGPNHAEDTP